jgi:hypothetical protein
MLTPPEIKQKLTGVFTEAQASALSEVLSNAYAGLARSVDMTDLKEVVKELAQAQQRTEIRLEELAQAQQRTEIRLEELAQAQQRTEIRLEELAQAQQRTEIRLEELAQAQQRTEERLERLEGVVENLAQAQQRTEERLERLEGVVENLAQAQQRTEEALQKLTEEHRETRRQLGGLAMTVGYTLEDAAFKALPALLQADYGLVVQGRLKRTYVLDSEEKPLEVNIFGRGVRNGQHLAIVGEAKSQLSTNDVDRFLKRKVERLRGPLGDLFLVLVTYMTTGPEVEAYARDQGLALYFSYDF